MDKYPKDESCTEPIDELSFELRTQELNRCVKKIHKGIALNCHQNSMRTTIMKSTVRKNYVDNE